METLNNEYASNTWYLNNANGVPMVALNYVKDLIHALYPEYAYTAWDYMKHFSRDQKTGVFNTTHLPDETPAKRCQKFRRLTYVEEALLPHGYACALLTSLFKTQPPPRSTTQEARETRPHSRLWKKLA